MRRPLSGALLGILLGLAVAVILQQQGIWPLDKITVFLLPALVGLLGMFLTSIGRQGSKATMTIALIITIPMAAWGATGLADINETGELNGGCEVVAASDVDATTVDNSSRRDPFEIDPAGGLTWAATSPGPITDHIWEISVEIGGFDVTVENGGDPNDALSEANNGDVDDVTRYAEDRGIPLDELRGVFIVGGFIEGTGGVCDGFGFVTLTAEPFETLISKIALGIALLALLALLLVALTGRAAPDASPGGSTVADSGSGDGTGSGGFETAAAMAAAKETAEEDGSGVDEERDTAEEFMKDITHAAHESGLDPDNPDAQNEPKG